MVTYWLKITNFHYRPLIKCLSSRWPLSNLC